MVAKTSGKWHEKMTRVAVVYVCPSPFWFRDPCGKLGFAKMKAEQWHRHESTAASRSINPSDSIGKSSRAVCIAGLSFDGREKEGPADACSVGSSIAFAIRCSLLPPAFLVCGPTTILTSEGSGLIRQLQL